MHVLAAGIASSLKQGVRRRQSLSCHSSPPEGMPHPRLVCDGLPVQVASPLIQRGWNLLEITWNNTYPFIAITTLTASYSAYGRSRRVSHSSSPAATAAVRPHQHTDLGRASRATRRATSRRNWRTEDMRSGAHTYACVPVSGQSALADSEGARPGSGAYDRGGSGGVRA